jgi:molecular chaperone DnaK (HSP70)
VTVQPAHGLSPAEVEQLVSESIENAADDFTARRLIELRNKAENDLRHTDKALNQAGDRLTADQRAAIAAAGWDLRAAIDGADLPALQRALDRFGAATNPLAQLVMNEVVRKAVGGKTEADLGSSAL